MNRTRFIKIFILFFGFLILCGTTPRIAIEGRVVEVQGSKAKIEYEGKYAPRIGDRVSIGFKIGNDFVPVEVKWKSSYHTSGWGWAEPGKWKTGEYTVEIFVKHQKVAQESFFVD
jgi:hypothetical protein